MKFYELAKNGCVKLMENVSEIVLFNEMHVNAFQLLKLILKSKHCEKSLISHFKTILQFNFASSDFNWL